MHECQWRRRRISTLSDIGVSVQKDGTLAVDSTKLSRRAHRFEQGRDFAVYADDQRQRGHRREFSTALQSILASTADRQPHERPANLDQGHRHHARCTEPPPDPDRSALPRSSTALDQLTASMNKTSQYLTQQLANLPSSK